MYGLRIAILLLLYTLFYHMLLHSNIEEMGGTVGLRNEIQMTRYDNSTQDTNIRKI